ncbi:Uncharacterised protein [Vibrio cholerae]|nr:Uncharacterised protein [Vibrio cholerae]
MRNSLIRKGLVNARPFLSLSIYPSYLKLQRCWLRSFTPIT